MKFRLNAISSMVKKLVKITLMLIYMYALL